MGRKSPNPRHGYNFELSDFLGAGVERGATDKVESFVGDFFAALGIEAHGALGLSDSLCGFSDKRSSGKLCHLIGFAIPAVRRLRVQFKIDRLAPRRLACPISGLSSAR